ncbi:hypothetical protein [Methylocapsa acidiphila]|uniref:pyroglutamyl-peptidase I family protein n=1 Tax=Methylocapsa acidiphila TaxID=133552 RepID=UPI00068442C4|nr:hypothetical protein [Methylocapsa acidiphila]
MNERPIRILITGFGGFPGARKNPTEGLIHALGKKRAALTSNYAEISLAILPVDYAVLAPRLKRLTETFSPDAILHFGLASRRKVFCVETRAFNRVSVLHHDAAGTTAGRRSIVPGAPFIAQATLPPALILAALRRTRIKAALSIDAGDYLCNQAFYLSLIGGKARAVGFIHIPPLASPDRPRPQSSVPQNARRPNLDHVTQAALAVIRATLVHLRRVRQSLNPEDL